MSLKPIETIERILISSTSRFIDEFESDGLIITHVWPGFRSADGFRRIEEGPLSRSAFMLSFTVPEVPRLAGIAIPNYEAAGDLICSVLSLFYGKRFDSHGCVESHGNFRLPNLEQYNTLCIPHLPQNNHSPRSDINVPLNLRQIARILPLLTQSDCDPAKTQAVTAAAKFYHQALQNGESDPEVAYLHLITAGEILANAHCPQNVGLLSEDIRMILDNIRTLIPDGEKAARKLASQMHQIKLRFCQTIEDLIDDEFFSVADDRLAWRLLSKDNFLKRIAAAYDVRSQYVHSGVSFGELIRPQGDFGEVCLGGGPPVMKDGKLAKLIYTAPTYIGLERIIRYCLIRFA